METPLIVPESEPFFLPGGPTGCLLLHGFTSMPEEMRWLGEDLVARGHTVLCLRLAGHATLPQDLARTRWQDWLISVEEGLALLHGIVERIFVIGLSMGGVITLLAAANYPMAGAVAMSTPYQAFSRRDVALMHASRWFRPVFRKGQAKPHATLGPRREAGYPAYAEFPARILPEVAGLQAEMQAALGSIRVPVLLIQSRADTAVLPEGMPLIYGTLGTPDKEMLWLEDFNHALVRDPKRQEVFEAIAAFLERVTEAEKKQAQALIKPTRDASTAPGERKWTSSSGRQPRRISSRWAGSLPRRTGFTPGCCPSCSGSPNRS